jgi:hypothetical protein
VCVRQRKEIGGISCEHVNVYLCFFSFLFFEKRINEERRKLKGKKVGSVRGGGRNS